PSSAPRTTPAAGRGVPFGADSFTPAAQQQGQPARAGGLGGLGGLFGNRAPAAPAAPQNQPAAAPPAAAPAAPRVGQSAEGNAFRTATNDFRTQLSEARDLRSQLDKLPADDP